MECPICYGTLYPNNTIRTTCAHSFHRECLEKWVFAQNQNDPSCPMCRTELDIWSVLSGNGTYWYDATEALFGPASDEEPFYLAFNSTSRIRDDFLDSE